MKPIDLHEAQQRLPELIDQAVGGEDIVISRGDGADVRLVPVVEPAPRPRRAGSMRGKIHMADDFDDPIPGFEPYT